MATTDELLDALMKDYKKPEDLIGENGLLKQLWILSEFLIAAAGIVLGE